MEAAGRPVERRDSPTDGRPASSAPLPIGHSARRKCSSGPDGGSVSDFQCRAPPEGQLRQCLRCFERGGAEFGDGHLAVAMPPITPTRMRFGIQRRRDPAPDVSRRDQRDFSVSGRTPVAQSGLPSPVQFEILSDSRHRRERAPGSAAGVLEGSTTALRRSRLAAPARFGRSGFRCRWGGSRLILARPSIALFA